jgi:hypothetical protein
LQELSSDDAVPIESTADAAAPESTSGATHALQRLSVHDDPAGALDRQVEIASGHAANHPDDAVANEGAAEAYQDREIFSPPREATASKSRGPTAASSTPRAPDSHSFPTLGEAAATPSTAASRAKARDDGNGASGEWTPQGSRAAAGLATGGSDPDDDELDAQFDSTDWGSDGGRSSGGSTVRSDYGEEEEDSSEDGTVVAVGPTVVPYGRRDATEVLQLSRLGSDPLEMVARNTLPDRRLKIPDMVADVATYVSTFCTTDTHTHTHTHTHT